MSDLFHAGCPLGFIRDVFDVMAETPQHTYQVLTKRRTGSRGWPTQLDWPGNVWMGVSVENDRRRSTASTTCERSRPRCGSCRASRCSARSPASTSTASTG